jgi:hypothetical protein
MRMPKTPIKTLDQRHNGIHGPGCECTPESALHVQYTTYVFCTTSCDRDCDNYHGRRLLLSDSERRYIFNNPNNRKPDLKSSLLSKIIEAFIHESDESPYRFWLASCIQSYLRGSSPGEQIFAAQLVCLITWSTMFLVKDCIVLEVFRCRLIFSVNSVKGTPVLSDC